MTHGTHSRTQIQISDTVRYTHFTYCTAYCGTWTYSVCFSFFFITKNRPRLFKTFALLTLWWSESLIEIDITGCHTLKMQDVHRLLSTCIIPGTPAEFINEDRRQPTAVMSRAITVLPYSTVVWKESHDFAHTVQYCTRVPVVYSTVPESSFF